ncbi:LOW QUALITY PROTEIN: uncharacterized protein LOC117325743 [Pecten maximus]|uniref:LOW QUALITY PROTEIN: uncharacterized protein LOC117325743 n=1 Tax=Pecten maximus TaxID=6579 RepID=UPI00145829E6|nr:LOW QUALITY PROTEIN: uncharacterized protein LOC117325743 [Pecten maximus]
MGVIERTRGVERDEDQESVYTYSSRPTTPGDRKGLLVRFQLVSRTQPCVAFHYMSVKLHSKLSDIRRPINAHFKTYFDGGFIFLCKTKEIIKDKERQLTIFDILPKLPNLETMDSDMRKGRQRRLPTDNFMYPGVQYKELSYDIDGRRHLAMCACVVFLFERSKVSHWPPDKLQEELSAGMLEGFSFIPSDIMSWKEKLVESRATTIHGYAACNQMKELKTAIHQLPEFVYVQNMKDQRGAVPLHYAAENGHLEICEILIATIGKDLIYQQDVNRKTPLHCALYRRKMQTSVYLLQLNSDLIRPDIYGNTCMDLLHQQSSKDMDFIISKLQIDCIDDVLRYHLAWFALKKGDIKASRRLTESVKPSAEDKLGENLLHVAADMGDRVVVEQLISNKFDLSKRDVKEYLPFHRACAKGNKEIACLLLYPDIEDSDICNGVSLAVKHNCYTICSEMRLKKPSLVMDESSVCTIIQHLDTMLSKVSKEGKSREKELKDWENILMNVIPLLQNENGVLETYVYDCARHNLSDALTLLKSIGASFNDRDFMGRSPLHEAAERNSGKAISILLKENINPNAVDWRGSSALHYACAKGHLQSVKLLMGSNKNVEAGNQNASGRTPLLEAAYSRKFEVVQYMVDSHINGINITATDSSGQCILHHLTRMPEKVVDLVLTKYSSVEKTKTGKCFKRTLWSDSVKHSAWSRHILVSRFRATWLDKYLETGKVYYTDSKTGEKLEGPFNNGFHVASWNSRSDVESSTTLSLGKSPKMEINECTRCKDFVGKLSAFRGPHRCTLAGIRQHEGEGEIRRVVHKAFKHHFVFQQDVISPVFNAVKTGNVVLVKKLLKFDPEYINETDNLGRTLIELAIDRGSVKMVQVLLELQQTKPNPGLVYRVLLQKKKNKNDNTRKMLLNSLIAKGHFIDKRLETGKVSHDGCSIQKGKFCHRQCYLKGYTPLEVVVRNNDEDLFKLVLDKSGKGKSVSLMLAAYKGHHSMLEAIKRKISSQKKDKNEDEDDDDENKEEDEMDERILLDIACRSPHITVDMIKLISKLYPEMFEQNTQGTQTEHPANRRYLQFDIPKRSFPEITSLGKIMSEEYDLKRRILSKSKIEDNACQLIDEGINLGKVFIDTHSNNSDNDKFIHGCCECLLKAMEGKFYKVAERILLKEASTIWKCAMDSTHCRFQDSFKKRMFNRKLNHMHEPQYIEYLLLLACSDEAPKTILQLLLQHGFKEFDKDAVPLDDMDEITRAKVEKIKDPFLQKMIYITQLMPLQRKGRSDIYKLVQLLPNMFGVLQYVDSKLFKQPKRSDDIGSFLHTCCSLSRNGRSGYDTKMVHNKVEYIPVELPEGLTPLHMICVLDNVDYVKEIVKCGTDVDINMESANGIRAVDVAAACGNWPVFKFLLDKDAEVNSNTLIACCAKDRHKGIRIWMDRLHTVHGKTLALEKHRLKIAKELCSRNEVNPSYSSESEECPLGAALQSKLWDVAEYLCTVTAGEAPILMLQGINRNSKPKWALEAPKDLVRLIMETTGKYLSSSNSGNSSTVIAGLSIVLQTITKRHDFKLVDSTMKQLDALIADDGKWLEICRQFDQHGMTIFHCLSQIGHTRGLEVILKRLQTDATRKEVINKHDSAAASALWYALANKHWSTATLLLMLGANGYTKRSVPDFETKRPCSQEKQNMQGRIARNDSAETSLCFAPLSTFFSKKNDTPPDTKTKPIEVAPSPRLSSKTDSEKVAVKRLVRIAQLADVAGCNIIHAVCATGNYDLVQEILKTQPNALKQKDDRDYYPFAYAVIGGNEAIIELLKNEMTAEIAANSLQPYIWKIAYSEKDNKLHRSFTQLLGQIIGDTKTSDLYDYHHHHRAHHHHNFKTSEVKLSSFRWGEFYSNATWPDKVETLKLCMQQDKVQNNSIDQVMEHIEGLRNMLLRWHSSDSFLYLNREHDNILSDEYAKSLLTFLLNHIKDVDSISILSLVMMQKAWILKELLESNASNTVMAMKTPLLLKYSIVDCIFIFASPEDERLCSDGVNQRKLDKYLKEMMSRYSLNLSPGIGTLAVKKDLWVFLEHALFQIFENEGSLSDEWHSILATGAERGQLPFLRSILDKLHIPRMTPDQKSCFTAYLCLACRAGKTDVVKYLLRHNVPTVGSMDEYPICDILGKRHEKSWNILQYVFYGKSESTLKEILSVLKTEKEFLKNLEIDECIKQSGKTGRPGIVHQMAQFFSMAKNQCVLKRDWDIMLQTASRRGHEDLCIYLIEKQSANETTSDNYNMSPLHYCGYYGMEKLAVIIAERLPSALERTDNQGLTPKDYANSLGRPYLFKGSRQTLKQHATECDGWLRCLLTENAPKQQDSTETIFSPHVFAQRDLSLKNLLLRSDDHASENIIRWSSQEFIRLAEDEPQQCVEYFILAAACKCNKSLRALCDVLQTTTDSKHNLQSLLMKDGHLRDRHVTKSLQRRRGNGLTPLGWAIYSQNMEGVEILMEKEVCLTWRETYSLESILHIAVKTGNVSITKHVNEKTDGKLIFEEDRQKVTPLAIAVALGLHRTFRVLTKNKLKSLSSTHDRHGGNRMDYGCVDCLLDNCIGWSKNYLSGDSEATLPEEEDTRIVFQKKNNRGYVLEHRPYSSRYPGRLSKIPYYVRQMCTISEDNMSYQLHKIHYISALDGLSSKLVKSALFSMGYKADVETMQWIVLRSLTDPFEAAKKAVRAGFKELAVKFIPQLNDEQAFEVFETAAVAGKTYLIEQCLERFISLTTNAAETKSVIESAVAFGQTALSVQFLNLLRTSGHTEQFDSFRQMFEAIPQKILWLMGDQIPGNDQWIKDIEQSKRLTLPDVWLSMEETDPLRSYIEERITVDSLLPETVNGKKFVPDKESFRKYPYFKEKGDIWVGCFIASSQILGHVYDSLSIDDPRATIINTIKITCLPPGSSDHPKMNIETNGMLIENIAVAIHNETPVLQHDPSFTIRSKESSLKDVILTDIIPAMEEQMVREFGISVRIRVDWSSIDARKRTSGSETILKALTGDNFNNKLGGLQDVLDDCTEIKDTIRNLFNDETVTLALKPVAEMKYITVTFVDNISSHDGQKKSRSSTPDSNVLWSFSMERSTMKYDRSTFPLWFHLNRYRTASVAFCDSIYRISHFSPLDTDSHVNCYKTRKNRQVTFELEWSSFQTTDEKAFMGLVGHGIARELQVMAYETEAMLRLTMSSNRVTVKNCASALYTGINLDTQGKAMTASVYVHQSTKKTWVVENGRTAAKLGDLEDKQLSCGSWQKDTHSLIEEQIGNTRKIAQQKFGINIDILFDEKRVLVPLLSKCRREMLHPHHLIQRSMKEFLQQLIVVYEKAMYHMFSGPHASYSLYMQKLDVQSGIWKDYIKRHGKNFKQNKGIVSWKYKPVPNNTSSEYYPSQTCIEDYNYANHFQMEKVSQEDIENKDTVSKCYELMYATSKLIDRSHSDNAQHIRFVSCNGSMYEIVDHNALMRALCKLPTKAVMGHDVLDILDLFGSERLFIKLFPTLIEDIRLSSTSITIPVMYDLLYRTNCLYAVHHIQHIIITWDELFECKIANRDDNVRNVQRIIRTLGDTLEMAYRKEGLPCDMVEKRHKESNKSLMKISSLHLTKLPENFKPDASVVRIIQPKEKDQPHLHLRSGHALTVAYQNFQKVGVFHEILLITIVHILEVEVKTFIEKGIAKDPEKDKWRKKQYDGPKPKRPDLCYVESVLPRVLSCLADIINTADGKEFLTTHFVDFQFAQAESNTTTVEFEDGWLICSLSPEDMGANVNILLMTALKSHRSPSLVLNYNGSGVYFTSKEENTIEVTSANRQGILLQTMCDKSYFTVHLWTKDQKNPIHVKPHQVTMNESQQAIQIKWKSDDDLPSNRMGHAKLMYGNVLVERQINTYFCKNMQASTETVTKENGLQIKKGGKVLVVVEHDSQCHVKGRHNKTDVNQKTEDIQNGIRIVSRENVNFLIKTKTRSFKKPHLPIEIRFVSGNAYAQCIKLVCLDTSRRVRLRSRCCICGSILRMVTPSAIIPPGKDMIIN